MQILTDYAARAPGAGSFVPQFGQFDPPSSTPRPQFGQVGSSEVPQCGQNVNPDFASCAQPGQALIGGSRSTKYRMMPMPSGINIASSVHIT